MGVAVRLAKASAAFGVFVGQLAVKVVSAPPVLMYRSVRAGINPDLRTEHYFSRPNPLERLVGIGDNWPHNIIDRMGLSGIPKQNPVASIEPPVTAIAKDEAATNAAKSSIEAAGKWSKGAKWGIGVGIGAVALAGLALLLGRGKKEVPSTNNEAVLPVVTPAAQQMLENPETTMAAEAAEGYAPNQWQQTIAAQRGQAPKDMGPINPKMNVVPETSIQTLGAPPVIAR